MKILWGIILVFSIISCKSQEELVTDTLSEEKKMIIQLKKTPCYGECPVFVFQVFDDYSTVYKGIRFTDKIGTFTGSLSKEEYDNIINKFEDASFLSLNKSYKREFIVDLPSIVLTYNDYRIDIHKAVAPQNLKDIASDLEDLSNSLDWNKISDTIK